MSDDHGADKHSYCPSCGLRAVAGVSYCGGCGYSLARVPKGAEQSDSSPMVPVISGSDPTLHPPEELRQGHHRRRVWGLGALALLIIAAGVIFGVPQVRRHVAFAQSLFGETHVTNAASSNAPASEGPTTLTPEQQFAKDAIAQITTVSNAVDNGTLTDSEIGEYGDSICNLMPQYLNRYGPGPSAFYEIANEFALGFTSFRITGADGRAFVSLAIKDICPTYSGEIPAGATG